MDLVGYIRDAVAAGVGLAILFGVNWTSEQVGGILLLVTTVGALGAYIVQRYVKGNGTAAGE